MAASPAELKLAGQLRDLLRDRTMTLDQLASVFSIRHSRTIPQALREVSSASSTTSDFLRRIPEFFEFPEDGKVRTRKGDASVDAGAAPQSAGGFSPAPRASAAAGAQASRPPLAPEASSVGGTVGRETSRGGVPMKYAELSRALQALLKEHGGPLNVRELEDRFSKRFGGSMADVAGMPAGEYLERKAAIFLYDAHENTVALRSLTAASAPAGNSAASPASAAASATAVGGGDAAAATAASAPAPSASASAAASAAAEAVKDEAYVVREFEALIEAMGPVSYISTACGKFIQRCGVSVSSIVNARPLEFLKRHPDVFLIVGAGNVTLRKYEHHPEVQRLLQTSSRAQKAARAAADTQLEVPAVVTEQHVVDEFRRLILADGTDTVYISSLCGRFLQRFKQPVTAVISCKPVEFLRQYPDVFVLTGGGNVGLREVLGPDAVSVAPPPLRAPRAAAREPSPSRDQLAQVHLTDEAYCNLYSRLAMRCLSCQAALEELQEVRRLVERSCFLALDQVVIGGSAARGLPSAISAATSSSSSSSSGRSAQGELVLFVKQLPRKNIGDYLPHILETLMRVLESQLAERRAKHFRVDGDCVSFRIASTSGCLGVELRVVPAFDASRQELREALRTATPRDRRFLAASLVGERNALVAQQPTRVRMLMFLVRWWSSRQRWSTQPAAPSDWFLDLATLHVALRNGISRQGDFDLAVAIASVLDFLSELASAKVLWTDTDVALYSAEDLSSQLPECQAPVFLDPVDLYCNMIDANFFDYAELVALARHEDRLHCFRREAAVAQFSPPEDDFDGTEGEKDVEKLPDAVHDP